jgi:hypothetical protein
MGRGFESPHLHHGRRSLTCGFSYRDHGGGVLGPHPVRFRRWTGAFVEGFLEQDGEGDGVDHHAVGRLLGPVGATYSDSLKPTHEGGASFVCGNGRDLDLGGFRAEHYDRLLGQVREALPAIGEALGVDVDAFADNSTLEVGTVVWATGFRPDYSWLHIPGVVDDGRVAHRRGVTEVPGLYLLGLSWQHSRGSTLLGFVNDDAAYLAGHIAAQQRAIAAAEVGAARQPAG